MLGGTGKKFYMDWEWHAGHCLFYWEKMERLKHTGVTMEARYSTGSHVAHCTSVVFSNHNLTSNAGVLLSEKDIIREPKQGKRKHKQDY